MDYTIRESEAFSVIGQEIELTNYQRQNIQLSIQFWKTFNQNLKKNYLSQSGNWIKYAFMQKRDTKLYYYCAIPKKVVVPEGFTVKEIPQQKYLVAEHLGHMDRIYDTYTTIYQELLPQTGYERSQTDFLHFEKYDYRFHWNRDDSVIEIWVPINT
ncbi:MAG: GyrI-like domain-containing protein [bacterium]|nr:GyrI-like domain-containing protein [bacterium]